MFKWACLGVAAVFLGVAGWMLNDIRMQVRQSAAVVHTAGATINENLPPIVARSKKTAEVVSTNLPQVVDRVNRTTEVVAELAEDIRQLKHLLVGPDKARDKTIVAYATSVLEAIEKSGGVIGTRKVVGKGLSKPRPAAEWVAGERKEALFMTLLAKSKKDMLNAIVKTRLGASWYIELPGKEPVTLLEWLRENHAETRDLG